jgi:hypothetical protein
MSSAMSSSPCGRAKLEILAQWYGDQAGHQIKIDGKALRGTATVASKPEIVQVLRAWVEVASAPDKSCVAKKATNWMLSPAS